jgi:hypothetical protein
MHPLVDLSTLKDPDLQNRISELTRKYFMTTNSEVKMQIANVLDMYNAEVEVRSAKQWEDAQKNQDNGLDKLINIS